MQTLELTPKLAALLDCHAILKEDLAILELEISECPRPRDADGAECDCAYGDFCDQRDALYDQIEAIEAEIQAQMDAETEAEIG